ncbi:hypothetical protein M1615_00595 [Patescibacteria group bacterium]|nr:hypothetical protein [Patescibacteria group bacterium]MCL5010219.1 hypothetical protein [Patescibacteria group bacterium]
MDLNSRHQQVNKSALEAHSSNNSYSFFKILAIGFAIVSFCLAIGVIGYILWLKK